MIAPHALPRVLASLVRSRLPEERRRSAAPSEPLGDGGWELDSIELVDAAAAVNRLFHLHEIGVEDYLLRHRTIDGWSELVASALAAGTTGLTFATSGSTGTPRHCTHSLETLQQEADVLASIFAGRRRIVSLVPAHHLYGFLFTVLLPEALEVPVLEIPDGTLRAQDLRSGDLIVAFPLRWRCVAASAASFPSNVAGVTSTAPCPSELFTGLVADGLAELTDVYGASETGGVGYRRNPNAPYCLLPYWRRRGDGEAARLVRTLPDGTSMPPQELMDRLRWDDDRAFHLLGRLDGAVQVGGLNVFPSRVASVVCEHPDVAEATVHRMSPDEGERLKAFVVPAPGAPDDLAERLHTWLRDRLTAAERPGSIITGDALPASALGKRSDW